MPKYSIEVADARLVVQAKASLEEQALWLLKAFKELQDEGKKIADGIKIEVGWSIFTLIKRNDELIVCEPDYNANPFFHVREDISRSLEILAQQNDVLARVGSSGSMCSFKQKAVMAKGCLKLHRVYLERSEPTSPNDSGWYIGPGNPSFSAKEYQSLYTFQLVKHRPSLLQVLTLPVGYLVVFDGDRIRGVFNERHDNVWKNR